MKNRKFIGDRLAAIGWDIETYTSKVFSKGEPQFWAEFTYCDGYHSYSWDIKDCQTMVNEMTKFIIEATLKQDEFNKKFKTKVKK
jgi:hypothetical protein